MNILKPYTNTSHVKSSTTDLHHHMSCLPRYAVIKIVVLETSVLLKNLYAENAHGIPRLQCISFD